LKLDSILQILLKNQDSLKAAMDPIRKDTLFFFNPNEITYPQMILLGFDSILAQRVVKFRNSKGRFYVKRDLLKIYGLTEELYTRLADFISLPDTIVQKKRRYDNSRIKAKGPVSDGRTELASLNINVADTNDLKRISGIGSVLSGRIIKYRDLLGGYSNINQLVDVYGLKGRSLENLKSIVYVDSLFIPEKIRINFSEWEELVRHPYINSQMANDIINLRSEKGYLNNMHDLEDISYLNDSVLSQLEPYLEF
jgi:competence ComEA-like helix-hairpin-helix protein